MKEENPPVKELMVQFIASGCEYQGTQHTCIPLTYPLGKLLVSSGTENRSRESDEQQASGTGTNRTLIGFIPKALKSNNLLQSYSCILYNYDQKFAGYYTLQCIRSYDALYDRSKVRATKHLTFFKNILERTLWLLTQKTSKMSKIEAKRTLFPNWHDSIWEMLPTVKASS